MNEDKWARKQERLARELSNEHERDDDRRGEEHGRDKSPSPLQRNREVEDRVAHLEKWIERIAKATGVPAPPQFERRIGLDDFRIEQL